MTPILERVLHASSWQEREKGLRAAYELVAARHNDLGITASVPDKVSQFHDRPFMVIQGGDIAQLIWDTIEDPAVRALPFGAGKLDQIVDSTDILSYPERFWKLKELYQDGHN